MTCPFASSLAPLDAASRAASAFIALTARLFAVPTLALIAFIPLDIAMVLCLQPPEFLVRISINVIVEIAALLSLRSLLQGNLDRGGNGLALAMMLAVHGIVLAVGLAIEPQQPLSVGVQVFAFDVFILLFAIVFASRRIATMGFAVMVIGHVVFYTFILPKAPHLHPSLQASAQSLLRDGLVVMALLFCLGITLMQLIETAHQRSDEALRETRNSNETLERLVRERTRAFEKASQQATEASRAKS